MHGLSGWSVTLFTSLVAGVSEAGSRPGGAFPGKGRSVLIAWIPVGVGGLNVIALSLFRPGCVSRPTWALHFVTQGPDDDVHVVLTKRSDKLKTHRGERVQFF
jgi:hypothetical protein